LGIRKGFIKKVQGIVGNSKEIYKRHSKEYWECWNRVLKNKKL
jgi:hypothetical protein